MDDDGAPYAWPKIPESIFSEIGRRVSFSAAGTSLVASVDGCGTCRPVDIRRVAMRVLAQLTEGQSGRPFWVGAACAPLQDGLSVARAKAARAAGLGRMLWPAGGAVLYEDVWVLEMLRRDPATLRELASILEPIQCSDTDGKEELLTTLETFVDQDLSQARTARRLGVHRHTVAQRIEAAERLLGRSLRMGRERTLLELAIKARRLVAPSAQDRSALD